MEKETKADLIRKIIKNLKTIDCYDFFVNNEMEYFVNDHSGRLLYEDGLMPITIRHDGLDVSYNGRDLKGRSLSEIRTIRKGIRRLKNKVVSKQG